MEDTTKERPANSLTPNASGNKTRRTPMSTPPPIEQFRGAWSDNCSDNCHLGETPHPEYIEYMECKDRKETIKLDLSGYIRNFILWEKLI